MLDNPPHCSTCEAVPESFVCSLIDSWTICVWIQKLRLMQSAVCMISVRLESTDYIEHVIQALGFSSVEMDWMDFQQLLWCISCTVRRSFYDPFNEQRDSENWELVGWGSEPTWWFHLDKRETFWHPVLWGSHWQMGNFVTDVLLSLTQLTLRGYKDSTEKRQAYFIPGTFVC